MLKDNNMTGIIDEKKNSKKLKDQADKHEKLIESLQSEIEDKERKIDRLKTYGSAEDQKHKMELNDKTNMTTVEMIQEMKSMDRIIKTLRKDLQEALSKQHEAMNHAVRLAKKNRHLENELRDVDRLAQAIDAECNATLKDNLEKFSATKDKLDASLHKIYHLEKKVSDLKEKNDEMKKKIEELERHCKELKRLSNKSIEEKERELMAVKMNEKELLKKIDQVSHTIQNQKYRIMELENNVINKESSKEERSDDQVSHTKQNQKYRIMELENNVKNKESSKGRPDESKHHSQRMRRSSQSLQASDEDLNEMNQKSSEERIRNRNQNRVTREENEERSNQQAGLREAYKELQQDINVYEDSPSPKNGMRIRIHSRSSSPIRSYSIKATMEKLEHERDLAKADVERLQEEVSSLRERLEMATEVQLEEKKRYEQFLAQEEERVKKLESECRNLHKNQGVLCGKVKGQEESISKLKNYLSTATKDLQKEDSINKELRALQEETARSLLKAEEKAAKLEEELNICHQQMKEMEENQREMRSETATMQKSVTKMSNGKGLQGRQQDVAALESQLNNLKRLNEKQKQNIDSLENVLSSKRKESLELKSSNQQLQLEVEKLQNAIADLQKSLEAESEEVRYYQTKAQQLSDELKEIQRGESNGRQRSKIVLEKEARSRSCSPIRTKVTVETGERQVTRQATGRKFSNSRNGYKSSNSKSQGLRFAGSPSRTSQKKSCSLEIGNHIYDFEVEDNVADPISTTKDQSTYRLTQPNGQLAKQFPRRSSTENDGLSNKTNDRRNCYASPKIHVHAGLPSGSEVSLEYEEQEERDSD